MQHRTFDNVKQDNAAVKAILAKRDKQKGWYTIKALADHADIYIYGDIVSDRWDETEVTAKSFIDELNGISAPVINLHINSGGGAVFEASAIYTALRKHPATITAHIDGVAASAASFVAMAAESVHMSDAALFMIHNPWLMLMVAGDVKDIERASEQTINMLNAAKEAMLNAYERKSTLSRDDIAQAMDDETWYSAEQAQAAGFVDEIFTGEKLAAAIPPGRFKHPPDTPQQTAPIEPAQAGFLMSDLPTAQAPRGDLSELPRAEAMPNEAPARQTEPQESNLNVAEIEAQAAKKALAADKKRRSDIAVIFSKFTDHAELMRECQDDADCTPAAASQRLLDALGHQAQPIAKPVHIETGEDERDKFRRGVVSGLMARFRHDRNPDAEGKEFRHFGFVKLAEQCLLLAGMARREVDGMRRYDLIVKALAQHTTSDFPNILEDVMHKLIVSNYIAFADTWRRFCRTGEVSDFRTHRRLKLGSFNNLVTVNQSGLYEEGTLPDAEKESQTATTKGRVIHLSRQIFVNDDMDTFQSLAAQMGRAAARTVEDDVYVVIAANPVMSDGNAFFDASNHANQAGSAALPTSASLAEGEDAMRSQTDVSGNEIIDVFPATFVGSLGNARTTLEIIGSEFTPETTGSKATRRRNALFGMIPDDAVIGTPRISDNAWYLFADPNEAPAFEVAFLDGVSEPFIDQMETMNPDGVKALVRLDYGVAAIDWRGAWKNPNS